jgi:AcrR family transcriptional regulator
MRTDARLNRERILTAAEEVFGAQGSAGSTEEVARRAEVGIATVFRHFPTKDQLIEATLVRNFERRIELAGRLATGADPGQALRTLVRAMIEDGPTKITLATLLSSDGAVPPAAEEASQRLREAVGVVLQRAQQANAVRSAVTVDEVYFLVRGLSQAAAASPVSTATMSGAIDVVLTGLAGSS